MRKYTFIISTFWTLKFRRSCHWKWMDARQRLTLKKLFYPRFEPRLTRPQPSFPTAKIPCRVLIAFLLYFFLFPKTRILRARNNKIGLSWPRASITTQYGFLMLLSTISLQKARWYYHLLWIEILKIFLWCCSCLLVLVASIRLLMPPGLPPPGFFLNTFLEHLVKNFSSCYFHWKNWIKNLPSSRYE